MTQHTYTDVTVVNAFNEQKILVGATAIRDTEKKTVEVRGGTLQPIALATMPFFAGLRYRLVFKDGTSLDDLGFVSPSAFLFATTALP